MAFLDYSLTPQLKVQSFSTLLQGFWRVYLPENCEKKWSTELLNCHVRCSRCRQQLSLFFDQHRHRIMHERRRFVGTANVITFFNNGGRDGWSQFKFLFGDRPSLADVILSVCDICKIKENYDIFFPTLIL